MLANLQIKEGRFNDALKLLHGIPESNTTRAGLSLLGYCYFYVQDFNNAAGYYEQLSQMYPENDDYRLYHSQCLYQACLYEEAYKVTETITYGVDDVTNNKDDDYRAKITKLQAAIKYGQEDLMSAKHLIDSCPTEDPDTDVNLGCLLYKVSVSSLLLS